MQEPRGPVLRPRWLYAAAVGATIATGLASRAVAAELPWWLAQNAGDALYATMVFFGVGLLAPWIRTRTAAALALACCFAVEASQLHRAPWLDAMRDTLPGRLVLGQGFRAFDLVCYTLGVALGVALERLGARRKARGPSPTLTRPGGA